MLSASIWLRPRRILYCAKEEVVSNAMVVDQNEFISPKTTAKAGMSEKYNTYMGHQMTLYGSSDDPNRSSNDPK